MNRFLVTPALLGMGLAATLTANTSANDLAGPASGNTPAAAPGQPSVTAPLGTAFSYQGKLDKNGVPVNGNCNFIFSLYTAATGGSQFGITANLTFQPVINGLFTVALDFGPGAFDGTGRWLQIQVEGPGEVSYTTLTPRQAITPAPYSLFSVSGAGNGSPWVENAGNLTYSNGNAGVIGHGAGAPASGDGIFLSGNYDTVAHLWAYNYDINTPNVLSLQAPGGNVGIGTTTPSSRLEIAAQDALTLKGFQPYLTLKDTNAGNARSILAGGNGEFGFYPESFIGGNPAMTIKNFTGRVGVGTTTPSARLHVESSTASVPAIYGKHTNNWVGVYGESNTSSGTVGVSQTWAGVYGQSNSNAGVWGNSTLGFGVYGEAVNAAGVGGYFRNTAGGEALHVDGKAAVKSLQILGGADLAERFESADEAEPGTVMAIDPTAPGRMRIADESYCRRVAGVVSGARSLAAGVTLGIESTRPNDVPIALTGRVWVKCDARALPIHPGDLLTTSATPGHAMVAHDLARANGAILGKAMTSLEAGTGMVLVLVTLQ